MSTVVRDHMYHPVLARDAVVKEALDEVPQLDVVQPLPPDALGVAGVVGELDRVDGVDLVAEELEGEGGALVADVPGHDVALDGEDAAVEGGRGCVGHVECPDDMRRLRDSEVSE